MQPSVVTNGVMTTQNEIKQRQEPRTGYSGTTSSDTVCCAGFMFNDSCDCFPCCNEGNRCCGIKCCACACDDTDALVGGGGGDNGDCCKCDCNCCDNFGCGCCDSCNGCGDCSCCDCGSCDCGSCDCGSCDCGGCDCGGLDCSGMDCSGINCTIL